MSDIPTMFLRYMGEKIEFDMIGQAHRYLVYRDGDIKDGTADRIHEYAIKRFKDLGIDVSDMDCELIWDEDNERFHVSFDNKRGLLFKVDSIMPTANMMGIHLDHGVSIEEGEIEQG